MVAKKPYIPDRGDVAWVDLDPTRGHEQRGKRPVVVVSSKLYNARAGLALVCPITSVVKGYPFEVAVRVKEISGVILVDQVRSIDWKERHLKRIASAPEIDVVFTQDLLKKIISE